MNLPSRKTGMLWKRRGRSNTTGPAAPAPAARLPPAPTPKVTAHLEQQESRRTTRAPPTTPPSPLSSARPPTPTRTLLWRPPSTASWNVEPGPSSWVRLVSLSPVIICIMSSQACVKRGHLTDACSGERVQVLRGTYMTYKEPGTSAMDRRNM